MLNKRIVLLIALVIVIIGTVNYYNSLVSNQSPQYTNKTTLNKNPDFIYSESGWLADLLVGDWYAKRAYYHRGVIQGRNGVMVIHPISESENNYIRQDVFLPTGKNYGLILSLNDIAGKVSYAEPTDCNDVRFIVKIIDKESEKENAISDVIVNSLDGWVDLTFDVSDYAGKFITMQVESHAGGPCGDWKGEWAAVDYFGLYEK